MQQEVKTFIQQYQLQTSPEIRYMDLVSEIGELGKELLKSSDYGKSSYHTNEAIIEEMEDCLFSLLALCYEMGLEAEDALKIAMAKYQKRWEVKGEIGSGR